jgi:hypothetical protein
VFAGQFSSTLSAREKSRRRRREESRAVSEKAQDSEERRHEDKWQDIACFAFGESDRNASLGV